MINQSKIKSIIKNPIEFNKFIGSRSYLELCLIREELNKFKESSLKAKESSFFRKYIYVMKEENILKKSLEYSIIGSIVPIMFSTVKNIILERLQEKKVINIINWNKDSHIKNIGKTCITTLMMSPLTFLTSISVNVISNLIKTNDKINNLNINLKISEELLLSMMKNFNSNNIEQDNIFGSSLYQLEANNKNIND